MATDFWPNPRLFGTVPDPGIWFTLGSPNEVQCMAEGLVGGGGETKKLVPATTAADARVMDGSYQPVRGYAAGQWEAQLRLYRRLYASPELRPDGSAEADWYDAQSNSPLEHLGNTYQGILALSQYTAEEQSSLAAAAAAAKAATDAIVENNEAIATALENEEPVEELLGTQGELDAVLASATDAYTAVLSNAHNIRLAQAQERPAPRNRMSRTSKPYVKSCWKLTPAKTVCRQKTGRYSPPLPTSAAMPVVSPCCRPGPAWIANGTSPPTTIARKPSNRAVSSLHLLPPSACTPIRRMMPPCCNLDTRRPPAGPSCAT